MGMDVITNLKVDEVLKQIGIDNPTVADRATVMNYNKLLESIIKSRYSEVFSASESWTCPAGVTKVFVTACAGGGGGCYDDGSTYYAGGAGGATSFGALLTLSGGGGGVNNLSVGVGGGHISGNGGAPIILNASVTSSTGRGGDGGSSVFSTGPSGLKNITATNNAKGTGGAGNAATSRGCCGGGAGAGVIKYPLTVAPGTVYTITIGAGGSSSGMPGGAGYMIIEYNM